MSILDEIYRNWYIQHAEEGSRAGEAQKAFDALWQRAEAMMDGEFSEELRGSIFAYMDDECRQDFQAGFRLGARLMQELHTPVVPQ